MPAPPRWLLAVPDAIRQLETLDRDLLTRRDVERLFGVSRARAATADADLRGRAHRPPANAPENTAPPPAPDGTGHEPPSAAKQHRRERLLTELRTARLTGIRVAVPVEALEGRLASLPEGVNVARDRIEVRFSGAQEAVARLYALAQVLSNDYDRFETLVGRGEVSE